MTINIQRLEAKDGNLTLSLNGLFIHSKYKPIEESKNIAQKLYEPHHLHVIYGYGLGYVVNELIKQTKFDEPILVIDPLLDSNELEILDHKYERLYFTKHDNIPILANMLSMLTSYSSKVTLHIQANYNKIFSENLVEVLGIVKDAQIREIYNVNTINLFSMQWQINTFMNMKSIIEDMSLTELFDTFSCPVVVASGGPSLIKQLPLIKQYRENLVLICSGTTINTLLSNDITPDYVVTIDGGEVNYNHFKDLKLKNSSIVYAPTNHYKIRNSFMKKGYVFIPSGSTPLQTYYYKKIKQNYPVINGGGSVAHYAFTMAKKITNGPICLVGQDLAYTNNQTHAAGNKNAQDISKEKQEIILVDGYYGDKVKSNDSFKTMIYTFEQLQLVDKPRNEIFNCTEGGAKINLIDQMPFKEFLEKYANAPITEKITLFDKAVDESDEYFEAYVKSEINNYNKIIDILESGINLTRKEKGPLFKQSTLNKLAKIDKKLNRLYVENNVDSLLQPIIFKNELKYLPKLNESTLDQFNRVKEYTISLYDDCKKQLKEFIVEINKIMEEYSNEQ